MPPGPGGCGRGLQRGAQEQAGREKQHERERHLERYEKFPEADLASSRHAARLILQRWGDIRFGGLQRRNESERDACQQREHRGEKQRAAVGRS